MLYRIMRVVFILIIIFDSAYVLANDNRNDIYWINKKTNARL